MGMAAAFAKAGVNTGLALDVDRRQAAREIARSSGPLSHKMLDLAESRSESDFKAAARQVIMADKNMMPLVIRIAKLIEAGVLQSLTALSEDLQKSPGDDTEPLLDRHLK